MDGLLLDTERIYKAAFQHAGSLLGYEMTDQFYLSLVGRNGEDTARHLCETMGDGFPLEQFRAAWQRHWSETVSQNGVPLKAGVHDLVSLLDTHAIPRAIATSSAAEHTWDLLERAELVSRFDAVVTGDQIQRGKPAPDIYVAAAGRLGIAPEHCVALEDSDAGLLAASRAGMTALMIPDLKPPSQEASEAAYRVLPSLDAARMLIEGLLP